MNIFMSPMRQDQTLSVAKSGECLIINGEVFDFSIIPDGATLPRAAVACEWLASDVERIDGELRLTLVLPHGPRAPRETLFPTPITQAQDGPVTLPAYALAEEETTA